MHERTPLLSAALLGASGVLLGALGAHALAASLASRGLAQAWDTAVLFHLLHALALLGLAGWMRPPPTGAAARRAIWAGRLWTAGTVLFSGSLYILALGGPAWVGPVTPLGGLLLIAGWLFLAGAALAPKSEYDL